MNALEKIIAAMSGTMQEPTAYGWFHLMMFTIMIGLTIAVAIIFKKSSEKQNRIILLVYAGISLLFEVYKQLVFSYNAVSDTWSYHWYAFPFQFCSTPMYVALAAALLKKGKVQDAMYAFLATYGLIGGLITMVTVGDIFVDLIGINIQTMVHHGGQVLIGTYLFASGRVKTNWKTPLKALPVFATLVAIALGLNITVHHFLPDTTFNMFFISPFDAPHIPVFPIIYNNVWYPVYLLTYLAAFTAVAYITTYAALGVKLAILSCIKICKKTQTDKTETATSQKEQNITQKE
jgi:hypothetical protein